MESIVKKFVFFISVVSTLVFSGCGDKEVIDTKSVAISSGTVAKKIVIGAKMEAFTLNDQFEKPHTLDEKTKKIIFVFTKATGHMVKGYLNTKPVDYLQKRDIAFVADVSPMPSIIRNMFAIPDLQEHEYPVWLILDEAVAAGYKPEKESEKVMIITLDNLNVSGVKFVATEADIKAAID